MALIISTLKQGKTTLENVYAKVNRIVYYNTTKKASYGIVATKSKEDTTIVFQINGLSVNVVPEVDMVKQCYENIPNLISVLDTKKTELEAKITADEKDRKSIWELSVLKANKLYNLVETTPDI